MKNRSVLKVVTAAASVALLVVIAGCAGSAAPQQTEGADGDPVPGGTLRFVYAQESITLDPAQQGGLYGAGGGSQTMSAIYDTLFVINSETSAIEPRLATSLEAGDTNADWTLTLRDDVEFSDGTPFDAEAVKFNWERIQDPATESDLAGVAAEIAGLEVVDAGTLDITLTGPNRNFDFAVASRLNYIGSPTAMQEHGDAFGINPVGAGPFVLKEWVRDSYKDLERNENYWDAPRPYVDALRMETITDGSQLRNMMLAGEVDIAYTLNLSDVEPLEEAGMDSVRVPTPGSPNVILNNSQPPFDDPDMRRAVSLAVDLQQLAANTRAFDYMAGPFPDGSPFNFGFTWPEYDPETAQELFDAYSERTGGPVTFTLQGFTDSTNREMTEYLQSAFNAYDGVEVSVDIASVGAGVTNVYSGTFEANTWGSPYKAPGELVYYMKTGAQNNVMMYSNAEVDAAFDALAVAQTDAEAEVQEKFIVERMVEDLPFMPLGARASSNVFRDNVHGVTAQWDGLIDFGLVWLSN